MIFCMRQAPNEHKSDDTNDDFSEELESALNVPKAYENLLDNRMNIGPSTAIIFG